MNDETRELVCGSDSGPEALGGHSSPSARPPAFPEANAERQCGVASSKPRGLGGLGSACFRGQTAATQTPCSQKGCQPPLASAAGLGDRQVSPATSGSPGSFLACCSRKKRRDSAPQRWQRRWICSDLTGRRPPGLRGGPPTRAPWALVT